MGRDCGGEVLGEMRPILSINSLSWWTFCGFGNGSRRDVNLPLIRLPAPSPRNHGEKETCRNVSPNSTVEQGTSPSPSKRGEG